MIVEFQSIEREQIKPDFHTIDTPVYRDAWRELIKSKSTRNITYSQFLRRMHNRNMDIRRKEFGDRSFVVTNKMIVDAMAETSRAAGNPGKN